MSRLRSRLRNHDRSDVVKIDLHTRIQTTETAVVDKVRYSVCFQDALRKSQLYTILWSKDWDQLSPNVYAHERAQPDLGNPRGSSARLRGARG